MRDIHLACLADEPVTAEQTEGLTQLGFRVSSVPIGRTRWVHAVTSLATGGTVSQAAFRSSQLTRCLRSWAGEIRYDACLISSSSLVPYVEVPELQSDAGRHRFDRSR